ncbi:hypothetical protein ABBQ32_004749 [Trebouxia sp. C0010 RCD-2024]
MALTMFGTDNELFAPFNHLSSFHHLLNRDSRPGRDMHLDVLEGEKNFVIKADLPGVDKKDIKVSVDEELLTISVAKKDEKEQKTQDKGVRVHRMERTASFMSRTIRMPTAAELGQVKATYNDGVLQLQVPKKAQETRQVTVPVE